MGIFNPLTWVRGGKNITSHIAVKRAPKLAENARKAYKAATGTKAQQAAKETWKAAKHNENRVANKLAATQQAGLLEKGAQIFTGGPIRAFATAAGIDHFAFGGKGREWAGDKVFGMAEDFVGASVNTMAEGLGLGQNSGPAGFLKDNWGTLASGVASIGAMLTGNSTLGKLGLYATIAYAIYKVVKSFLPEDFKKSVGNLFNPDTDPTNAINGVKSSALNFARQTVAPSGPAPVPVAPGM